MKTQFQQIKSKIQDWQSLQATLTQWRNEDQKIVFTNGCFDLLHFGHFHYLMAAADLGDKLVVGLNSAASVARLKGKYRPINDGSTRQFSLASLSYVDAVVEFEEDTPFELIKQILPDVLVKGGDYQIKDIIGADLVISQGGIVKTLDFVEGYSTTNIEKKIRNS